MKTKILLLSVLTMIVGFSSCNLDPKVYSEMTDDNFPKSIDDADQMLKGLYAQIKNNSGGVHDNVANGTWEWPVWSISPVGYYGFNEVTTNETYYLENTDLRDFTWGVARDTYSTYILDRNIARATKLLSVLGNLQNVDEAKKQQMIAETKTVRAQIMYALHSLYGPVPMALTMDEVNKGEYLPRPTEDEYVNQMIKDLTEAIPNLPGKTQGTSNWGRVNKGMADMLLMKIYMNNHEWSKALPYAEDVTKLGYSLSPNYFDAFGNEQSNEIVWAIPSGTIADNEFYFYAIPGDCNEANGIEFSPYWGVFTSTWEFYNTFTDKDVRKKGLAATYKEYYKNSKTGITDTIIHDRYKNPGRRLFYGPLVVKYKFNKDVTSSGRFHQVCYRYADIILSLAEIENNLHGPTDKAMSYLKMITDRAGTTSTIPSDIQSSKEKFNEFLLAERGRELYLEGWRREDMIRFGTFISEAKKRGHEHAADYMKLLPIPSKVITESGGVVKQNPGYQE